MDTWMVYRYDLEHSWPTYVHLRYIPRRHLGFSHPCLPPVQCSMAYYSFPTNRQLAQAKLPKRIVLDAYARNFIPSYFPGLVPSIRSHRSFFGQQWIYMYPICTRLPILELTLSLDFVGLVLLSDIPREPRWWPFFPYLHFVGKCM